MSAADAVLDFWFRGDRESFQPRWFQVDPAFDAQCREAFGAEAEAARQGALDGWAETPRGALALALLLDQFPRNLHRGRALAFASDAAAQAMARRAVLERRLDLGLTPTERVFLYLPFEHAESRAAQDISVTLFEGLRDSPLHAAPGGSIDYAWAHRAVIRRFARFPRRNAALGRASTAAEEAYMASGDAMF